MELIALLGLPLLGGAVLAVWGARPHAAEINALFSLATFVAGGSLTARVMRGGPLVIGNEQFFIDAFNVFQVALTSLVGLTTALFSRPYMRIETDRGHLTPGRLRLYHSMYQLF
ncbi:MAG: hypothetical protein ACSLE5_03890, partial [Porticoccaceae bacterium]